MIPPHPPPSPSCRRKGDQQLSALSKPVLCSDWFNIETSCLLCQWNDEPSHHLGDMLHLSLTSHSVTINIIEPGHWTSVLLKSSTFAPLCPCIPLPVYCLHPLCPVLFFHLEPSTFFVQEQQEKISGQSCWNFDGLNSWSVAKKRKKDVNDFRGVSEADNLCGRGDKIKWQMPNGAKIRSNFTVW